LTFWPSVFSSRTAVSVALWPDFTGGAASCAQPWQSRPAALLVRTVLLRPYLGSGSSLDRILNNLPSRFGAMAAVRRQMTPFGRLIHSGKFRFS
jgi:hypothetical protein